jgi:hypothetical protein
VSDRWFYLLIILSNLMFAVIVFILEAIIGRLGDFGIILFGIYILLLFLVASIHDSNKTNLPVSNSRRKMERNNNGNMF